ncbi:MAG: nicotinamide-nucleotide amidohydrolase family protein [Polyangiaceae bacterium]
MKQADVPDGAKVLANNMGTAPGFSVQIGDSLMFFTPGVPREMKQLWVDHIENVLRPLAPANTFQIRLKTFGLPESVVGEKLAGLEAEHAGLTIGYRASMPEIEVKVHVRDEGKDQARSRAHVIAELVRQRLGPLVVFGEGDDTLPEVTGRAITARSWRLAIAESCTGGLVGHLLTSFPASDFFVADAVTYANSAKTRLLGVDEDILRAHGAVSEEVAAAMATGIRRACEVEISLAITGIAGPTGGTPEKPVGLVYLAVAHPGGVTVQRRVFPGDRAMIQRLAAHVGLSMLREVAMFPPDMTPRPPPTIST